MGCSGKCCEEFTLTSLSKTALMRRAQNGETANGTNLEMKMIADMTISLDNGRPRKEATVTSNKTVKIFKYRCKWHDKVTGKCTIYSKRPVMCRIFPSEKTLLKDIKDLGCDPECFSKLGTPIEQALKEFKEAWGLIK
jgi:Fe-S-cluster containining protein